jgi:hypothetical protein
MAAPNSQPAQRGSAAGVNQHGPVEGGMPASSKRADLGQGVAAHGTPSPTGAGKKNPLR